MGVLYEKSLKLSKQAMAKVSTGHINNMVSSDAERFVLWAPYFPFEPSSRLAIQSHRLFAAFLLLHRCMLL